MSLRNAPAVRLSRKRLNLGQVEEAAKGTSNNPVHDAGANLPSMQGMNPSWIRRSKIIVEVLDDELLVTMPGTTFSVLYAKTKNDQLIVSSFSGRKVQDEKSMVSFPHFLSLAWTAANQKAKEIGWIVSGRTH